MAEHMPELSAIVSRLERVEKENRGLRRAGLVVMLLGAAVLVLGEARPNREMIAQRFILADAVGNRKGELGLSKGSPHLWLYGVGPQDTKVSIASTSDGGSLSVWGAGGSAGAILWGTTDGAVLNLFGGDGTSRAHLAVGTSDFRPTARGPAPEWLELYSDVPGPSLEIRDKDGYAAVTGSVGLSTPTTGESRRTSAASVVLFGKDRKVLWSAP
jgi:hypothetical protein